jgi:hypothetical protein
VAYLPKMLGVGIMELCGLMDVWRGGGFVRVVDTALHNDIARYCMRNGEPLQCSVRNPAFDVDPPRPWFMTPLTPRLHVSVVAAK